MALRLVVPIPVVLVLTFCIHRVLAEEPSQVNPALSATCELERIEISSDGRSFVLSESGRRFSPWGFNYDHDRDGRLLDDYWIDEWDTVVEDFQEMKSLGANVVRIHPQFGRFMDAPDTPNLESLDQLKRILRLAEDVGLYLDLTGLGCYHKADVPVWYDELDEAERWDAQAVFWESVAGCCASSPAVFCYDLMNEPVVPGGTQRRDDWLGPAFAGKHFVQFISLESKGRERSDIARAWIEKLVSAIRAKDDRHLITVGLVHWSLDRPGLTSGFIPERIAESLDFLAVHIYPETDKLEEALEMLRGFDVGKPIVIEETFPLKCGPDQWIEFYEASQDDADGWIGFYWGKRPDEYAPPETIGDGLMLRWLELFQENGPDSNVFSR
jgi:hypothetical protein